ncbi:MAG: hypothetical protein AMXMBFR6_26570 [Betaproteobacteria bacterium]|nr:MAG: hypothetical protein BroJett031_19630 [Betaproteobacteria bacterium]
MTITDTAQAELNAMEAAGEIRRVPHRRHHIKVYESSRGLVALETSRSSRKRVSAKLWFSFDVGLPDAEFFPAGRGRTHALKGLSVDEHHDAWAVLIDDHAPDANRQLKATLDALRAESGVAHADVLSPADATKRDDAREKNAGVDGGKREGSVESGNAPRDREDSSFVEEIATYQGDPAKRRAVEEYAVSRAIEHYKHRGFQVDERGRPYDLDCSHEGLCIHVEVKGTTGGGERIILTRNEVRDARNPRWRSDLFVVRGIRLTACAGQWIASGGEVEVHEDWVPDDADLEPTQFEYRFRRST